MRRFGVFISVFSMIFALCGCKSDTPMVQKYSQTEFLFDTVVNITVYAEDDSSLAGAFELCEKYENMFSRNIEGSDVWRINHAKGESVTVDSETAYLIELSLKYSDITDGAFDITIAPLSELWGFSAENPSVPSQDSIEALLPLVDYTAVSIDGCTVTVPDGCGIDLGAVAKGYISDRLCDYFMTCGVSAALINLGGNVATVGTKPDGSSWQIGIRDPGGDYPDYVGTLSLGETSVVTSGIYERCFEEDGVLYHHILSSENGYPVNNSLASVTVICKSGVDADALSTSLYLMGFERAFEFVRNSPDTEAVFITTDGEIFLSDGANFN